MCRQSQQVIEFIGRRWLGVVLIAGYQGARRFGEYRRYAEGISDRVLTQRLRELEQYGLIERTVVPSMPVQVTYTPTDRGRDLVRSLQPLFAWMTAEVEAESLSSVAPFGPDRA
jgi:DNA-binding HxlR family transcriptional regulator